MAPAGEKVPAGQAVMTEAVAALVLSVKYPAGAGVHTLAPGGEVWGGDSYLASWGSGAYIGTWMVWGGGNACLANWSRRE